MQFVNKSMFFICVNFCCFGIQIIKCYDFIVKLFQIDYDYNSIQTFLCRNPISEIGIDSNNDELICFFFSFV